LITFLDKKGNGQMKLDELLGAVQSDQIEFVTMRPEGSPFATLERRIVVTGPPELVELASSGDVLMLDELVKLMNDPDRAWAAGVLLAAMTRREEKMVDSFAAAPDQWWNTVGKTSHQRWSTWLKEARGLEWDSANKVFVETE